MHIHPALCNESAYWFDGVRVCGVKSSLRQPLCKKEYVGIFAGKQTLVKKMDFQSAQVWRVPCSMPIIWPLIPLHLPYTSNSSGELCPQALASQDSDCISALTNPPSRASFCANFSHFIHCKNYYNPYSSLALDWHCHDAVLKQWLNDTVCYILALPYVYS